MPHPNTPYSQPLGNLADGDWRTLHAISYVAKQGLPADDDLRGRAAELLRLGLVIEGENGLEVPNEVKLTALALYGKVLP
jgi:hypothetical protein